MHFVESTVADDIIRRYEELYLKGEIDKNELLELLVEEFDLTKNKINGIIFSNTQEIIDYSDFGKPDEDEKKKIDSWDQEYREKVKGKIEFGAEYNRCSVTILTLPNDEKLIFDKYPIKDSDTINRNRDKSMQFTEDNNRKIPSKEEFEKLFEYFKGDKLIGILNLKNIEYWAKNDMVLNNNNNALCGNFKKSYVHDNYKYDVFLYILCTHC